MKLEALIVSKTHVGNRLCVGALCLHTFKNLRLYEQGIKYPPLDTDFDIGQIWELDIELRKQLDPPHIEDVIVLRKTRLQGNIHVGDFVQAHTLVNWKGSILSAFDGCLQLTQKGHLYCNQSSGLPDKSVGFWIPDVDLLAVELYDVWRYRYMNQANLFTLKYVGLHSPYKIIPAGTVVRLSLSRYFNINNTAGFWLQLSGAYLK